MTTTGQLPEWLDPAPFLALRDGTRREHVRRAMTAPSPTMRDLAALLSPAAIEFLEPMALRARAATRRYFGRTISLYVPLYLSNHCPGGCVYCGFAADRDQPRRRLEETDLLCELRELKAMGFNDILLLTGERCPEADFDYLLKCVSSATRVFHNVTPESFAMSKDEYAALAREDCTGITLYQETYDTSLYRDLHRLGPKRDYGNRLDAPDRALAAGMRTVGPGALLGLGDPFYDALCLALHLAHLKKSWWRSGVTVSFPRLRPQAGDYRPSRTVSDRRLAQIVFAFRICFPDVPLVLSTRESPAFRDGIADIGISRMSVASRTTVGGYGSRPALDDGQFEVNDNRDVDAFCRMLRDRDLEPVFKNWDSSLNRRQIAETGS